MKNFENFIAFDGWFSPGLRLGLGGSTAGLTSTVGVARLLHARTFDANNVAQFVLLCVGEANI